jgi:stringent starvation protein B
MTIEIEDYTTEKRAADKRDEFERMAKESTVIVQIDARRAGVSVPAAYAQVPNLILRFSPRFPVPLSVGVDGLRQELTFPREGTYVCAVPWSAVYAIYPDKHGAKTAVWASDVPAVMRRAFGIRSEAIH